MAEWIAGTRLCPARGPPTLKMRHVRAPLIARAGEHAPCGHWPILRERGRGDTGASLGFAVAEESKLLVTRAGRSSGSAKSTGRDLPTGAAVGQMHEHDQAYVPDRTGHGQQGRDATLGARSAHVCVMFLGAASARVWKQFMSPGGPL